MFSYKRTFSALIILWIALFFVLYIISLITWPKEEILSTEVTYSNSTLSAIIFAGTDNSYEIGDIDADIVFEKNLSSVREVEMVSWDLSKARSVPENSVVTSNLENVVEGIEKNIGDTLYTVGNEYIEEKIEKAQRKSVEVRGLDFIYDPSLSNIDKNNLAERFKVFAPKDDYNRVLKAMSQMALGEAGGCSPTEIAATVWSVLNRFDNGYSDSIFVVISASGQYHGYSPNKGLREDVYNICEDVIARWVAEKEGKENVGRVLPPDYNWFYGDGKHNHFRNKYRTNEKWDWSLPTPYDDLAALADKSEKNWL